MQYTRHQYQIAKSINYIKTYKHNIKLLQPIQWIHEAYKKLITKLIFYNNHNDEYPFKDSMLFGTTTGLLSGIIFSIVLSIGFLFESIPTQPMTLFQLLSWHNLTITRHMSTSIIENTSVVFILTTLLCLTITLSVSTMGGLTRYFKNVSVLAKKLRKGY